MNIRFLIPFVAIAVLAGCGGGKKKKAAEEPVSVDNFLKTFPNLKLPFTYNDSVLQSRNTDSSRILVRNWKPVISDSLFETFFGDAQNLHLYAIGKATDREKGKYVLIRAITTHGRDGYLFYFNAKNECKAGLKMVSENDDDEHTNSYARLDKNLSITKVQELKKAGDVTAVRESVYGVSDEGVFALLMTNSNEEVLDRKPFNPIDTFARRGKWSGDYVGEKNNIVSLRDGTGSKEYRFFIHTISEDGTCKGEIKGVGEVTGDSRLRFSERGGTCGIEFRFSENHVTIREVGPCGAYRGPSCFFEGTFVKKKVTKPKKKK